VRERGGNKVMDANKSTIKDLDLEHTSMRA
jgi:hypothetical protein